MRNTENKTKKIVALATYVVAVLCLLAGLFLPLFNGKEILALKLGEVFKSLINKPSDFSLKYEIALFGIKSVSFDFMALVIVLYTVVCALALLSFIPVALSIRKEGRLAKKFYYGIEIAALIVSALYFIPAAVMLATKNSIPPEQSYIPFINVNAIGYNMVIAAGGVTAALLVLCGLDKGKNAAVKIVLFVLSLIGFLALFNYVALLSKQLEFNEFTNKISSGLVEGSGADYMTVLFTQKLSTALAELDTKNKILFYCAAIASVIVLINLAIDAIKLATGKDKKFGRIFDISRYGLELIAAVLTIVFALVCKKTIGLMLIILSAVAAVQLAIAIMRLVFGILRKTDDNERSTEEDNSEITVNNVIDVDPVADESFAPVNDEYKPEEFAVPDDDGYVPPSEDKEPDYVDYTEPVYEAEPSYEEVKPVEEQPAEEPVAEPEVKDYEPEEDAVLEESAIFEPENGTSYLIPVEENAETAKKDEEEPETVEEPVETESVAEPVEEPEPEKAIEAEPVAEPEPEKAVEKTDVEEPAHKPYPEDIKPYNPYEKHSNPFRNYGPVQPYNPYRQQEQKPAQPTYEKPVQPTRPAFEAKPVQPSERPQGVRPLQPRPIIQEFKPVPPISEQPPKEAHVYTIDAIYAGPVDDFIRKLSNDERIEFAKTFIEKNRGNLGNIPDYVVGGDNKKFFSVAFIYLGRIRGLVSDGLLNKMYKELNLL